MKVKARYFARVREIVGKNEEVLEVSENTNVQAFLTILSQKYGASFREYVFTKNGEELSLDLNFLLDGKNINTINGPRTILCEGSAFAIIPPVGGG